MSCAMEKKTIFFVNYFSLQLSSVTHYIYIYILYISYIYVYVYYLYILYIYIYIYVVISDPRHTECSNLTEAR